jgi:hypothetical protein
MISRLAALAVVLSLALPAWSAAHPGHDHKIMGTIVAVDGDFVVVKTKDGELVFSVTSTTKYRDGRSRGTKTDLKPGVRVVVNVGDAVEPLTAKEVQYSRAAQTGGAH